MALRPLERLRREFWAAWGATGTTGKKEN